MTPPDHPPLTDTAPAAASADPSAVPPGVPSADPSAVSAAGWPEPARLPGQAAAHPGPVDMTMMYLMHHGFRRDLRHFAAAAAATPVDDRATWQALAERWGLFASVLHHHHSGEDAGLWPALLGRADDEGVAVLEAMEAEHGQIDPILDGCAAGFATLAHRADVEARTALVDRLEAAVEVLGQHLAHEEDAAIAIIQAVMTNEEFVAIEEEHFKGGVPFSEVVKLVPWVLHEVPGPIHRATVAQAGLAYRVIWMLGRRGFERRERAAFRYLA